jgi:hypothetical protein
MRKGIIIITTLTRSNSLIMVAIGDTGAYIVIHGEDTVIIILTDIGADMFTIIRMATIRIGITTGITTDLSVGLEGSSTGCSKIREAKRI